MKHANLSLLAALILATTLTTCDMPMGLGPPIDTTAPVVFIETPADNEFIKGVVQGRPVIVTGSWIDDFGVTSMRFEVFNKTAGEMVRPDDLTYSIDANGKWRAEITIPVAGSDDYNIKVFVQDKFRNEGAADVNVRIDIIPPWIKSVQTIRHPNSGFNFSSAVFQKDHYDADGYQLAGAYRNILYNKIDEYHNETFSLRVEIEPSYAEVAASRLFVKDENDVYLHTEELVPSGYWQAGEAQQRFPQWTITASQLERWRSSFSTGASYIFFEVWAWSQASWDMVNDRPLPGEPARVQRIDGTVWYPESDYPHVYINPENFVNDILVLQPNMDDALAIEFYDDDRLGVIYAKLLPKQDFETLAGADEAAYLNSLTDPGDANGKRAALISALGLTNALTPSAGDNRFQRVTLGTTGLGTGEYRLIALVKDDKSPANYSFEPGKTERWSAYPPLKIQIHNADAPFIFIENPERENVFPNVTAGGGNSFTMSGYTLGKMETTALAIAWVPKALNANGLANAITVLNSSAVTALTPGGQPYRAANGITVWKLAPLQAAERTVLNGVQYFRADFSKSFHIIDDFRFNNALENDDKLFVIQAANFSAQTSQTFNLPGLKTGPEVEVTSHRRGAGHDPGEDLTMRMIVIAGSEGVMIKPGSQKITDITGVTDDDAGFTGPTALNGNEWTRTIPSEYIKNNYAETTRVYAFRAEDILGNVTEHTREIILTDQPLLQSITCSEEPGVYGIHTTLRFEASFSMPVRVTYETNRAPKLKLYLTDPGDSTGAATALFADYDTNTPIGNTLFFTYTVQEGHTTNLLCTSRDAIDLNTALITSYGYKNAELTMSSQDGSLQNNKPIQLDGERPRITRASFAPLSGYHYSGVSYFTNGKKITLKLVTSEPVKIQGDPQAVIRYGSSQVQLRAQYSSKSSNANIDTLYFTHTFNDTVAGVSNIIPMTQLEWGEPFFDFTNGGITDMAGNDITGSGYATSLGDADRRGEAAGPYPSERGYIKTTIPDAPTYTLVDPNPYSASGMTPEDIILANPDMNASHVRINRDIVLRIADGLTPANGLGGSVLYYSLEGGNNPQPVPGTTGTGEALIRDVDAANKYSPTYERSRYNVTVWQEDLAGNRSASAPARQVTINSRFPELVSIEMALPDGVYPSNTKVTFRLNLSEKVKKWPHGATIAININDQNGNNFHGTGATPYFDGEYASQLSIDWTSGGNGKDIKIGQITAWNNYSPPYYGVIDEYGNPGVNYVGTEPESADNPTRPIGANSALYPFQLNRPDVEFKGDSPQVIAASPQLPEASGVYYNGGVLSAANNTFTLTFDVPVTKVHGKYITVRPYGQWAIPPVLSNEEMNALLNNPEIQRVRRLSFYSGEYENVAYAKWLTNVDANGVEVLPDADTPYSYYANNSYIKTTHGVTNIGGSVRPDTTTKWVLKFGRDLYGIPGTGTYSQDAAKLLRDVFTAAQWKQQRIHVGSSQVTINGANVTVTLSEALLPGRIWEVVVENGAFQDAAGNACYYNPYPNITSRGSLYCFWSSGTAAPVVRVNRISYNGGESDNFDRQLLPHIDTQIRIDCETPGAAIRYDVIRTRYLPAAAEGDPITVSTDFRGNFDVNPIFAGTTGYETDAAFFGNVPQIRTADTNPPHVLSATERDFNYDGSTGIFLPYPPTTGYQRNTIGNDDATVAKDANGFLNTLLVPIEVQGTGGGAVTSLTNGAPAWSGITTLAATVRNAVNNNTGAQEYRTVDASGAAAYGTYIIYDNIPDNFGRYTRMRVFYAGEAYLLTTNTTSSEVDPRLYSGRRDYVVAAARKNAVTDTATDDGKRFAGPQLAVSAAGTEGVYKTTLIYRTPEQWEGWFGTFNGNLVTIFDTGVNRMMIYGWDSAGGIISTSGFPFKGGPPLEIGTEILDNPYYKCAYRLTLFNRQLSSYMNNTINRRDVDNNYLWITWEIVTDWYQSAQCTIPTIPWSSYKPIQNTFTADAWSSGLSINGGVYGMIMATYGGVTYRYTQLVKPMGY